MSKFKAYKEIIFSDPLAQEALVLAVRMKGFELTNFNEAFSILFAEVKERDLQCILAPFLRALAIKHLRHGITELTQGFRVAYDEAMQNLDTIEVGDASNSQEFLEQQSQNSVFATDIEASALAEILKVTFACTRVNQQNMAMEETLVYRQERTENAYSVHMFNSPGLHFFVHEGDFYSTEPDGNCLYNAFAQILRQHILYEDKHDMTVYQNQQSIYEKIKKQTPLTLAELISRIKANTSKKDEADHEMAVRLAEEYLAKDQSQAFNVRPTLPEAAISNTCHTTTNPEPPKEPLVPITANFFFKIMNHTVVKWISNILLIAGLLAIGLGGACLCPVSAALVVGMGLTLPSSGAAATLAFTGAGTFLAGASILFFNRFVNQDTAQPNQLAADPSQGCMT